MIAVAATSLAEHIFTPVLPWEAGCVSSPRFAMTPFLRKILGMNWVLVFVMYGLLIFGVFMIESAARHLPVSGKVLSQFGSAGAYFANMQKN